MKKLFVAAGFAAVSVVAFLLIDSPDGADPQELEVEAEQLRQIALAEVNRERAERGLPTLQLGTNPAAQSHAQDMLTHRYLGHWWTDGRKPHMVYSDRGGLSYVSENVAVSGWNYQELQEDECLSVGVICGPLDPEEEVKESIWQMIYDDAHADWGHRDSILDPGHRLLNVGIAYHQTYVALALHLEGGHWQLREQPRLTGTTLHLSIRDITQEFELYPVLSVYHDPLPSPRDGEEIELTSSYCVGGGFTDECDGVEPVAVIIEPPTPGFSYTDLEPEYVVARGWELSAGGLTLEVDLGGRVREPGFYTVIVFADDVTNTVLIEAGFWVGENDQGAGESPAP